MQGRDDRHGEGVEQDQQMLAGRAAEDAVLMLDADGLRARTVDAPRGLDIVAGLVLVQLIGDSGGVVVSRTLIGHGVDVASQGRVGGGKSVVDVAGEGGDAAAARREVAN